MICAWLSLVEHLLGVQEVAGSNPVAQTILSGARPCFFAHSVKINYKISVTVISGAFVFLFLLGLK